MHILSLFITLLLATDVKVKKGQSKSLFPSLPSLKSNKSTHSSNVTPPPAASTQSHGKSVTPEVSASPPAQEQPSDALKKQKEEKKMKEKEEKKKKEEEKKSKKEEERKKKEEEKEEMKKKQQEEEEKRQEEEKKRQPKTVQELFEWREEEIIVDEERKDIDEDAQVQPAKDMRKDNEALIKEEKPLTLGLIQEYFSQLISAIDWIKCQTPIKTSKIDKLLAIVKELQAQYNSGLLQEAAGSFSRLKGSFPTVEMSKDGLKIKGTLESNGGKCLHALSADEGVLKVCDMFYEYNYRIGYFANVKAGDFKRQMVEIIRERLPALLANDDLELGTWLYNHRRLQRTYYSNHDQALAVLRAAQQKWPLKASLLVHPIRRLIESHLGSREARQFVESRAMGKAVDDLWEATKVVHGVVNASAAVKISGGNDLLPLFEYLQNSEVKRIFRDYLKPSGEFFTDEDIARAKRILGIADAVGAAVMAEAKGKLKDKVERAASLPAKIERPKAEGISEAKKTAAKKDDIEPVAKVERPPSLPAKIQQLKTEGTLEAKKRAESHGREARQESLCQLV